MSRRHNTYHSNNCFSISKALFSVPYFLHLFLILCQLFTQWCHFLGLYPPVPDTVPAVYSVVPLPCPVPTCSWYFASCLLRDVTSSACTRQRTSNCLQRLCMAIRDVSRHSLSSASDVRSKDSCVSRESPSSCGGQYQIITDPFEPIEKFTLIKSSKGWMMGGSFIHILMKRTCTILIHSLHNNTTVGICKFDIFFYHFVHVHLLLIFS